MLSLKRIRELANEYLGFRYPKSMENEAKEETK